MPPTQLSLKSFINALMNVQKDVKSCLGKHIYCCPESTSLGVWKRCRTNQQGAFQGYKDVRTACLGCISIHLPLTCWVWTETQWGFALPAPNLRKMADASRSWGLLQYYWSVGRVGELGEAIVARLTVRMGQCQIWACRYSDEAFKTWPGAVILVSKESVSTFTHTGQGTHLDAAAKE